jgi:hypothetical protein
MFLALLRMFRSLLQIPQPSVTDSLTPLTAQQGKSNLDTFGLSIRRNGLRRFSLFHFSLVYFSLGHRMYIGRILIRGKNVP